MTMRYLLILTVLFSMPLCAGSIQKWVDDEGNVHYGDAPPNSAETESVRVQRAPSNPGRALPRLNPPSESDDSDTAAAARDAEREEQIRINCERAQQNLTALTGGGRIKLNEPNGESRYLDTQEISERTIQAEKNVKAYCK